MIILSQLDEKVISALCVLANRTGVPIEEIASMVESFTCRSRADVTEDLKRVAAEATEAIRKVNKELLSLNTDNRPFYQKINEKKGKKGVKRW